jgi:hypothetical protein
MSDRAPPIRKKGKRIAPAGPICADESYGLDDFLSRVGWRRSALRKAKRNGLRVAKAGGRTFVLGAWFHEFLKGLPSNDAEVES